jgi:dimethylamine/trimethylamine dehydrogenase
MHPNHKILFEPVKLGPVTAPNRFYQVPYGPGAGNLLQVDAGIRGVRAEGGWGVVCVEFCSIHQSSDYNYLGMHRLWNDTHMRENAVTVEAIHEHGALAGVELGHFGMFAFNYVSKAPIWGPSRQLALDSTTAFPYQAQAIDRRTIKELLSWQRTAALRARDAGFDIIYVYAAHDQALAQQFLSPRYNRRTDEYGGSLENRARLLRQMIEVTKEAVGDRCAIAVRISVDELRGLDGMTADREGRQVVELLAELPDLWDVNVSDWSNDSRSSRFAKEGWQEDYVAFVKQCTTKPVVGVGRFTSPDTMASQIRRGILDLIGAARPSIADPFLPRKIEEGRLEDIRECIGCNYCIKTMGGLHAVSGCTQNPTMGEEWRLGWHPEHIPPKSVASQGSVLVVGAGPAGLEVTRALAQRGYQVSLAEAGTELGGRVRRESALPGLQEWSRVADWRIGQILRSPQVTVYKNNRISGADVLGLEHEHVIIATGSMWRRDGIGVTNREPIEIQRSAPVLTPDDLMDGQFPEHGPVLVFDDDHYYLGGVLAEQLRHRNLEVYLVTPGQTISKHTEASLEASNILSRLREIGVRLNVHTNLLRIGERDLTLQCMLSGQTSTVTAATVILVTSREPIDELYQELMAEPQLLSTGGIRSVSVVGDAKVPDTIAGAVYDAHRCARDFDGQSFDVAALRPSQRSLY